MGKHSLRIRVAAFALLFTAGLLAGLAPPVPAAGPLTEVAHLPLPKTHGTAHDLVLVGDLAYVSTAKGLAIIDISTPTSPALIGSVLIGAKSQGLDVAGNYAYLASPGRDFVVVDVSDPTAPSVVARRSLPGSTWDVAVTGTTAYVGSFGGEIYVFDVANPHNPVLKLVIGVPTWVAAGQDAGNIAKLQALTRSGNAKVTDVSIAGNLLLATEWNYGRLYAWDISAPLAPVFAGTVYAKFALRGETDLENGWVYSLGAFGASSGVFSMPLSLFDRNAGARHELCAECDYHSITASDYGGITIVPGGKRVVYIAGKRAELEVLDVSDPSDIQSDGLLVLGRFNVKTGDTLGVKTRGDLIFASAGALGFRVYKFPGLSD